MVPRSYSNLLALASGDITSFEKPVGRLPRVVTVPGILSEFEFDDDDKSDAFSTSSQRIIIVANQLPLKAHTREGSQSWSFDWDHDALSLQLRDGLSEENEVVYVGCLKAEIDPTEQDDVAQYLLEEFKCVPTFLPPDLQSKFYHGFCKQYLWPLFHYMLPLSPDHGSRFDRSLWQAYVSANKIFADKVMEVISPDDDYVWLHDYHLMVLPTFLRKRFNRVKLGFFLHSPFPSSEIYRTLPVRDEILRALLNSDLIGFHTFDYARHFLTCCSRGLGLDYESKRDYIGIEYYGRNVSIRILPAGIHMGQVQSVLNLPDTSKRISELKDEFKEKKMLVSADDMDIFKGISLKLLALEHLLKHHAKWRGKVVLVQILNPARGKGKDVQEIRDETYLITKRINETFGDSFSDYTPVVLIDKVVPLYERYAFYSVSECCVVNAVRDGMNLTPYEYVGCRQGTAKLDKSLSMDTNIPKRSMLVVSEFLGCSPSLSGAIRVNPWNIEEVAEAMNTALTLPDGEQQLRHEKHYRYVSTHDVSHWARKFEQDLERACKYHFETRCWSIGFGLGFRVVALRPNFRKLSTEHIVSAYKRTKTRLILLDYDGTIMPHASINKTPGTDLVSVVNKLCSDPRNLVFVISGRGPKALGEWFSSCPMLGIAAEHGYFIRWNQNLEWEKTLAVADFEWKKIAEPVIRLYTETTDGSSMEAKESALVWHHQDADPDFGSRQAKELLDHLESVLANEPVEVKRGNHIVEVKSQGVSKGVVADKLVSTMLKRERPPDFVLCIGDDRSDEDMFESILAAVKQPAFSSVTEVFACTVGQKPSKAKYYLDDTVEVFKMLKVLAHQVAKVQ